MRQWGCCVCQVALATWTMLEMVSLTYGCCVRARNTANTRHVEQQFQQQIFIKHPSNHACKDHQTSKVSPRPLDAPATCLGILKNNHTGDPSNPNFKFEPPIYHWLIPFRVLFCFQTSYLEKKTNTTSQLEAFWNPHNLRVSYELSLPNNHQK